MNYGVFLHILILFVHKSHYNEPLLSNHLCDFHPWNRQMNVRVKTDHYLIISLFGFLNRALLDASIFFANRRKLDFGHHRYHQKNIALDCRQLGKGKIQQRTLPYKSKGHFKKVYQTRRFEFPDFFLNENHNPPCGGWWSKMRRLLQRDFGYKNLV